MWWCGGVLGVAVVLSELWNRHATAIAPGGDLFETLTARNAVLTSLSRSPQYLDEMIGVLGWEDTFLPAGAYAAWFAALGLAVLTAMAFGRIREFVALALFILSGFFLPLAAVYLEYKSTGIAWQGRYLLAWIAGLPLLAGAVVASRGKALPRPAVSRLPLIGVSLLVFADVLAFYWSMIRFGKAAKTSPLPTGLDWSPPGGWWPAWALYVVGLGVIVALTIAAAWGRQSMASESPDQGDPGIRDQQAATAIPAARSYVEVFP
jgi:hypothetical protein